MRELIKAHGGPGPLAKKLGYSSGSYVSQVAGPTPSREIGEKPARAIEHMLGLPHGWMDREGGDPAPPTGAQSPLVAEVVRAVMSTLEGDKIKLSAEKTSELIVLAYEQACAVGKV